MGQMVGVDGYTDFEHSELESLQRLPFANFGRQTVGWMRLYENTRRGGCLYQAVVNWP